MLVRAFSISTVCARTEMKLFLVFLLCVCLFESVSGDAPGDESRLCLSERDTPSETEVILLDSYNYINLLREGVFPPPVWKTIGQPGHTGWTLSEGTGGICRQSIQTCDYENGPEVDNWLFTQYIDYQEAREILVEVSYDLSLCSQSSSCSQTPIYAHLYTTNVSNSHQLTESNNYNYIGQFDRENFTSTIHFERPIWDEEFSLGFQDKGTCGTINRVRVYYKVCPSKVDGLAHYPALPLPAQNSQEPNVAHAYCAYNCYNSLTSGYKAHIDGRCEYGARCECRAGYEEVTTGTAARCQACPRGKYRSTSDTSCQPCPSNTVTSGLAVAMCPCLAGYHRATSEGPEVGCTDGCLSSIYVMAFTSGIVNAGADTEHAIEIQASGAIRSVLLPNLPGDDYYPQKGDLWKIPISNFQFPTQCIRFKDLQNIAIIESNDDGWHIDSIVTIVKDVQGGSQVATINLDANRWIDGNSHVLHRRYDLTLV